MNRIAAIDLGTNTVRIMVAEPAGEKMFKNIFSDQIITRLGEGLHVTGNLSHEAIVRTCDGIATLAERAGKYSPFELSIYATSAAREASNTAELDEIIQKKTGVKLNVISWKEEARLSLKGAKLSTGDIGKMILFDIGGGSTEYILSSGKAHASAHGTNLGVVRLAETYITKNPVDQWEYVHMVKEIKATVAEAFNRMDVAGNETLVGTAGTVTSLAAIAMELDEYDPDKIKNYKLSYNMVENMRKKFSAMTCKERGNIKYLAGGREDLIIPGIAIILATMEQANADHILVSDYGLREGLILDIFDKRAND
ncbi:Exopolyphosphatase [hydrothermal vent metagenome]|uniref:Exopolyphosphatase n=1 Tax=hydrothermal vent metagenome TaxID=652676 RepID=A0A3B1CCQ1_9ZZZZ